MQVLLILPRDSLLHEGSLHAECMSGLRKVYMYNTKRNKVTKRKKIALEMSAP